MVDLQQRMQSSVSVAPGSTWSASASWDPAFSIMRERARFQQKQLHEKEAKLMRLYEEQQERQERALQRVKGPWNPPAPGAQTSGGGQPVGAGKVRSLLQYRRDHGRDKSYPLEPLPDRSTSNKTRTQSLEPRKVNNRSRTKQNVLYFGGSHQDLRFSEELDYGQSFQVIDDQLIYDPALRVESDDSGDFHIKSFNNKRQFYEKHFTGEESDLYDQKNFQRLPNVGLNGSLKMSQQKTESAGKYRTYVSGKSTIASPPRSGLPTRQILPPSAGKKTSVLPPARPRLGLDSPPARSPEEQLSNLRLDSPTNGHSYNGNGTPPRLNGAGSPPLRSINGNVKKSPVSRPTKVDQMTPPVPASRTTAPRPPSSTSSSAGSAKKSAPAVQRPPANGLAPCRNCGRNFATDRIDKHQAICQKTASKKRKVFDPVKARVEGTEAAKYVLTGLSTKNAKQAEKKVAASKSNWRAKHEEFINNIRAAKEVQEHLKKGGKLSDLPPPPPSDYSDYVQCPHCQRKFNETAAARHIPKCATMQHNKPQAAKRPTAPLRSSSTFRKK